MDAPSPPATLNELLDQIAAAYRHKNYSLGLSLVKKAYELKNNDVSSMDRIGSVYYALGRYGEALAVWTQALPLERNRRRRHELENSISVTRRSLGLADQPFAAPAATAPVASAPPALPKTALSDETRAAIRALYKKGVKFYATGQYLQATTAFLQILDMDPGNADATKALQRLKLSQ
jgi:tetratricopeptide (TPR) repeat protein